LGWIKKKRQDPRKWSVPRRLLQKHWTTGQLDKTAPGQVFACISSRIPCEIEVFFRKSARRCVRLEEEGKYLGCYEGVRRFNSCTISNSYINCRSAHASPSPLARTPSSALNTQHSLGTKSIKHPSDPQQPVSKSINIRHAALST